MPTFLLSKWFWELIGAAAIAATLFFAYHHYEYLKAQAALVPALQDKLATYDKQASELAIRLKEVTAAREQADSDLTKAEGDLQAVQVYLAEKSINAPAQVNPVCRPSAADRKLRNDTVRAALGAGPDTSPTGVSKPADAAH